MAGSFGGLEPLFPRGIVQGKTVVTWNVDARQTAGRSFMSTGKARGCCLVVIAEVIAPRSQ